MSTLVKTLDGQIAACENRLATLKAMRAEAAGEADVSRIAPRSSENARPPRNERAVTLQGQILELVRHQDLSIRQLAQELGVRYAEVAGAVTTLLLDEELERRQNGKVRYTRKL